MFFDQIPLSPSVSNFTCQTLNARTWNSSYLNAVVNSGINTDIPTTSSPLACIPRHLWQVSFCCKIASKVMTSDLHYYHHVLLCHLLDHTTASVEIPSMYISPKLAVACNIDINSCFSKKKMYERCKHETLRYIWERSRNYHRGHFKQRHEGCFKKALMKRISNAHYFQVPTILARKRVSQCFREET